MSGWIMIEFTVYAKQNMTSAILFAFAIEFYSIDFVSFFKINREGTRKNYNIAEVIIKHFSTTFIGSFGRSTQRDDQVVWARCENPSSTHHLTYVLNVEMI